MQQIERILVKPDIKTVYLKNTQSEKITYLALPPYEEYNYSLEKDIKEGGVQFDGIKKLLDKSKLSRVITLTTDTLEMGLMAIVYLAMELNNRRTEPPFDMEDMSMINREKYYESSMRIPIIYDKELSAYLNDDPSLYECNGFLLEEQSVKNRNKPYWTECTRESVCLIMTESMANDICFEAVNLFEENYQVYVLFLDSDKTETNLLELPFGTYSTEQFHAIRNNFILSFATDEALVSFEDKNAKPYYRNILRQNLKQHEIKVKRGFSYERIVNLAAAIKKNEICQMIAKIINYAIKDMERNVPLTLSNGDFLFIDHFVKQKESSAKTESGRTLLEKNLVGLDEIKQQVYDVVNVMKYNQIRRQMNIGESQFHNVHVMLGAPGTAKTTVARYMGMIMFDEKLLPDNRFICINGAELKGMYVGHSAPKTKSLFESYDVIIIDEAYSIVSTDGKTDSFGNEAIAQLIIELEKHSTDKLVIFAGYGGKDVSEKDNRMLAFLDANPGIKSRITSTFYFKSYTAEDMTCIFRRIAENSHYRLDEACFKLVTEFFQTRVKERDFGNGREARSLLETTVLFAARRTMASGKTDFSKKDMTVLTMEDLLQAVEKMKKGFGSRAISKKRMGFYM